MDNPILVISSDEESNSGSSPRNIPTIDDYHRELNFYDKERSGPSWNDEAEELAGNTHNRNAHDLSESDSDGDSQINSYLSQKKSQPQKGKRQRKNVSEAEMQKKKEKEEKKKALNEERRRKKEEEAKRKADKKAASELLKKMKPGECMKLVTIVIDTNILACSFGGALLAPVQASGAGSKICPQLTPHSITWTQENIHGEKIDQNHIMIVWTAETLVQTVYHETLCKDVMEIQRLNPGKTITLVIFGIQNYFSQQKSSKSKAMKSQISGTKNSESNSKSSSHEALPIITRVQLEESLTEIQLHANCCHRLVESNEDVGQFILQFTKAIAETPYKKMMFDKKQQDLEWFAAGDSKDSVRIDKNGNGFSRLWQKQICQFNQVGLDLADAIISHYKTPQALITAYGKCEDQREAELLLKDLPVRRGVGPLISTRRVGPELSKKLYLFFTSDDETATFSQENK
nr:PREDICTED: crossover junction endonuclease EME1 [Bemisia tabaci]